jgi:2-pyrone-4,6-dicarboxylate lactonase
MAPLGWHLQVHGAPDTVLVALGDACARLAGAGGHRPHRPRRRRPTASTSAQFQALRRLMDRPGFWVKVSGVDRITRSRAALCRCGAACAPLVLDHGDRVRWGNDWPHPNHAGPVPDDQRLVDCLHASRTEAAQRQRLLVDNPRGCTASGTRMA